MRKIVLPFIIIWLSFFMLQSCKEDIDIGTQNLFFDIENVTKFVAENNYSNSEIYNYFIDVFNKAIIDEYQTP